MTLAPLVPADHNEPLSAVAYAVVRAYEQIHRVRAVEDDAVYVALRGDREDEATVVEVPR